METKHADDASSPHINVTPLIDVLLVLLIIFMVVTPLKPSRFKALVPEPPIKDQQLQPNILTLVVTIDRDLRLKLNQLEEDMGSVDDPSKLSEALAALFQQRKQNRTFSSSLESQNLSEEDRIERTVFIKAPRSIQYGAVAKVIDSIKGAGAQPIGLQVDDLAQ
jgi:biopolymer transport protein ExbD